MDWTQTMEERDDKGKLTDLALAADALDDLGCDCGTDEPGSCLLCVCERAIRKLVDDNESLTASLASEKEKSESNEYHYIKRMNLLTDVESELMRLRQQAPALIAQHLEMAEALNAAVARAERAEEDVNIFKAQGRFCTHIVGDGRGNPTRCTIREDYKAAAYTANDALAQVRELKEDLEVALSVAKSAIMERDKIAAARAESVRDFAAVYNTEITARSADGFTRTRPLAEWAETYIAKEITK